MEDKANLSSRAAAGKRAARLDLRLHAVADLVPEGAAIADIGCDHGRLPIALLESRRVRRAIGIDRAAAPLAVARRNATASGVGVELRLGEGLGPLEIGEVDCVVIAGIGGEAAAAALNPRRLQTLGVLRAVVQVNKKLSLVRRQFFEAGWRCAEETVVAHGDRFFITCAFEPSETAGAKSEAASGPLDLLVGPILRHRRGTLEDAYIRHLRGWLESIEAKGGNSLSISAGATAAMLLELEVTRLSLPSDT